MNVVSKFVFDMVLRMQETSEMGEFVYKEINRRQQEYRGYMTSIQSATIREYLHSAAFRTSDTKVI